MEELFSYVCAHAHNAHWIMFLILLLSGLNLPISEDLMLLSGGAIAAVCIPDHALRLYIWVFLGCYLSAWEVYWIGRLLGPRLYKFPLFRSIITPERMEWLRHYYAKFGVFTFILGRFVPGGVRNALFLSSGLTKMPFHLFIIRDGLACLISSSIIFSIGYHFATHIDTVIYYFQHYTNIFLIFLFAGLALVAGYFWYSRRQGN
jgi:membrane-associated protein